MTVLIHAHQANVEIVARKIEIIGVAAELRDRHFRRKDEAHVGVFLVMIKIVDAALVKRDDLAENRRIRAATFFELSFLRMQRGNCSGARFSRDGSLYIGGDVADLHELIELEDGTSPLRRVWAMKPFWTKFCADVESCWTHCRTQWWLVITKPCGEMKEAEHPSAMRREDKRT